MAIQNLIGQTFNYLIVIDGPIRKNKKIYWKCKCQCGKETLVRGDQLKAGTTKSCGCYKNSIFIENNKKRQTLDLTNQKFGKLTALFPTDKRSADGRIVWKCQCECGSYIEVDTHSLRQLKTTSCGCLQSAGELEIKELLLKYSIPFEQEKTFSTCRFPNTNYLAKFDFYINNSYLIEYDGEQHFYYRNNQTNWNTKEEYEKRLIRDVYKNNWCQENNIPLIRIPYTLKGKITLNDILLETSDYIFTPAN